MVLKLFLESVLIKETRGEKDNLISTVVAIKVLVALFSINERVFWGRGALQSLTFVPPKRPPSVKALMTVSSTASDSETIAKKR